MPDIAFATPAGPVEVTGLTPDLLQAFRAQAPDWPEADGGDPIGEVTVAPDPGGWRFVSSNYDAPDFVFDPGLGAGNGLIGCLIHSFVAASPGSIALHAGAVETEDGLTVLAGDMMAGKSTLTLALAALGHRVWCDDRLPVENKDGGFSGTALGLRPKLRWPPPPKAPTPFLDFIARREGLSEGGMRYVALQPAESAAHGAALPIRRILLLDRDDGLKTDIADAPLGETVMRLAGCTFAPHLGPVGLLERLRELCTAAERHIIRYGDSFEAAALIHRRWSTS